MKIDLSAQEIKVLQYTISQGYLSLIQVDREVIDSVYNKLVIGQFRNCTLEVL